jgi:sucrose-phosphate synthase
MVSFISINSQNELASIYRYLAKKKSIFVLTSLYEPFGLAPIEAMSSGLPAVVTKNGGPKDVLEESNIKFGVLVDPFDEIDMAKGIHEMFKNYELYKTLGKERVNQKYTWFATAKTYLSAFENIIQNNAIHHQNQVFSDFLGLENTKIKILEFLNSCEVKK